MSPQKLLQSGAVKSVLLILFTASTFFLGGARAEAASLTWYTMWYTQDCWTVGRGENQSIECGPSYLAPVATYYAVSDKDVYAPREVATVSVAATAGYVASGRTLIDYVFNPFCIFGCGGPPGVGASATYINTIVYCDASGSCSNTGSFRVPSRPGTYTIVLNGCDVDYGCTPSSMTFTVATPAPVCVGNQGVSCQSATNACGGTTAGIVQCDGSCSVVSAPANPAGYGSACTSAANACGQTQTNGTIQCNGSCSSTPPSNTTCPADLTAASPAVFPASGINVGQSISFSSLVSNIASGLANGPFPNIFRVNSSSLIGGSSIDGLAAGASADTTASFTPTSAGTYTVSACADNNTSWQGIISESNEGNNCGGNITFTAAPCTASLSPASVTIEQGQPTTLSWAPSSPYCGITSCTFADGASYNGGSGGRTVSPLTTSTYGLSCVGPYNLAPGTPPVYATVTVLVPTATLTVNGQSGTARVNSGTANNITVAWSSENATSCTITKNGATWRTGLSSSGTTDTVTAQTVYTIDCVNNYGVHVSPITDNSVRVNIVPAYQEF